MRIVTFVTQKGGTGKTTLATSLAVAAQEAGETVVILDLDSQETAFKWGKKRIKAQERAEKAGKAEEAERLGRMRVEPFPLHRIAELPKLVRGLKGFSLVIIDTPGVDSATTHVAMKASDFCLVPIQPTPVEAEAMMPTVTALIEGKKPFAMVLNRCLTMPNNNRAPQMGAALRALGRLAEPLIGGRTDFQDAMGHGLGVTEFAPKSTAASEIRELWENVDEMSKQ